MISNERIDSGKAFDWGLTSNDYAKYRDIYPEELYKRLRELGVATDGTSWLDIGTGTGILPQNLYNPKAKITGVDIAKEQIDVAKEIAKENGWSIEYFVSPAESTGLPDNNFDTITAAQCFWYFDRDRMKAEIRRMLKPNGRFIKIFMDWCLDDELAKKSTDLVTAYNSNWAPDNSGADDLYDDLFDGRITEEFYVDVPFTRESWHGRMCACRGTLASMSREQFAKWSKEHLKMLSDYPDKFTVKHKVYISYFNVSH